MGPGPTNGKAGGRAQGAVAVIRAYQRWVSPLFAPRCRFYPSCSSYAAMALSEYGLVKGGILALRRLVRCQPFSPGGVDYVPVRGELGGAESEGITDGLA